MMGGSIFFKSNYQKKKKKKKGFPLKPDEVIMVLSNVKVTAVSWRACWDDFFHTFLSFLGMILLGVLPFRFCPEMILLLP